MDCAMGLCARLWRASKTALWPNGRFEIEKDNECLADCPHDVGVKAAKGGANSLTRHRDRLVDHDLRGRA